MKRPNSNRSKFTARARPARATVFAWAIAALVLALVLALVPSPYDIVAPGRALDLSERVSVEGRPAPKRSYYLTDVTVTRASLLLLAWRFWPGVRLIANRTLETPGLSNRAFDLVMSDAMVESQTIAAVVAERAAGFAVRAPRESVSIAAFTPASRADETLAVGDDLTRVGPVAVRSPSDVGRALRGEPLGRCVEVGYVRAGRARTACVDDIATPSGPRFGIALRTRTSVARLPVPVRFDIGGVSGSSAGVMFALEIYAALHGLAGHGAVAGTGTLGLDGRVGPIEGAPQKLLAAERAGAHLFLVPVENYADVARFERIRVVPIATFADALRAVASAS